MGSNPGDGTIVEEIKRNASHAISENCGIKRFGGKTKLHDYRFSFLRFIRVTKDFLESPQFLKLLNSLSNYVKNSLFTSMF